MISWDSENSSSAFYSILEIYQKCRTNGDWAKLYLETQDGKEFFTISICPSAGNSAVRAGEEKIKKKKPSQIRRDRLRRAAFLERRYQEAAVTPATTTTPCMEATKARTDKVEDEGVETTRVEEVTNVTGKTSSTEATCTAAMENTSSDEKPAADAVGLSQEDIEIWRKLIKESVEQGNLLTKKALESWIKPDQHEQDSKDNENGNFEDVKLWALQQKQSFNNSDIRS